jgi:very-short-patch-repair endonuclease
MRPGCDGYTDGPCDTGAKSHRFRMNPTDKIQRLLREKPGLKAQQIAEELGLDRSNVVATLHGLGGDLMQDSAYRWWPRAGSVEDTQTGRHTFLANLCRYYLECLARESGSGVSIPAGSADYVVLDELPFFQHHPSSVPTERAAKKLIRKVRQERGQLTLYIGYAVRLRLVGTAVGDEVRIEPVLLYPVEEQTEELRPASGVPMFNLEVLKTPLTVDSGNVLDEAIQLSDELGLANSEDDLPPWDEIVLRLQNCRPDWNWREPLDPYALSKDPPLSEIRAPGIYNRAVLFAAPRSPFTYGLEIELRKLAQLDEDAVRNTALGEWLRGGTIEAPVPEDRAILEVVPLNVEQRQAVVESLSAPLTVVTGPPGTGKSQVVLALAANMAWQGASMLFASKNNHAVDVVETRANELGSHPLLLRLGREEHHARLAEELSASLAQSSGKDDQVRFAWLKKAHEETKVRFEAIRTQIESVIDQRNRVDELERASEPARTVLGQERFERIRTADVDAMGRRVQELESALEPERGVSRLLQPRRLRRVADAIAGLRDDACLLGAQPPAGEPTEDSLENWRDFHRELSDRLKWAAGAAKYWREFDRLRAMRSIEDLAGEQIRAAEAAAGNSLELWRSWLKLWPGRWDPDQRKLLSEYVSLLQMIAGGDRFDEGAGRRVFRRYYSLFPEVTKLLPCWAVTSLSARGRLPFEPGFFDLVVIDEASQCDIASALPLLYRARRAVIIGDPLQLKHVSTVAPQQDRLLLAAHGLAEGQAAWAYSVNSLFDLARSLCRHEDIVNLRDHHRSHRDIIAFSNRHFYRGGLRIATDHEALNRPHTAGPAVRWLDIRGRVVRPARGGAMNSVEAEAVVAELRKLVVDEGYEGAVGVVTPFRAQANRIRTLAHQDADLAARLTALQFVVDTVHGFQGDERDVIFFSPVVSAGVGESTLRFLKGHGNLFNVAVTRARSELIVVGDRRAALESGVNYLAGFAEYAHDLASRSASAPISITCGPEYPAVGHPEFVSEWERVFYKALYNAGLRPVPQYEEAPYTLDFALFEGVRKLDIEIDGENYHRNWDGELCRRDQIRTRRLNDLGWDVLRLWVYEVRDDLEGSIARVRQWAAGS